MNLKCILGLHEWRSTIVGELPSQIYRSGNTVIEQVGRTFWDNACSRCGKVVGPTYCYETEKED